MCKMFACKSLKYKVYKAIIFNMLSARPKAFQSFHFALGGQVSPATDVADIEVTSSPTEAWSEERECTNEQEQRRNWIKWLKFLG